MHIRELPSGAEVYCSPHLSDHVRLNRYFLTKKKGCDASLYEALLDLFSDSYKFSSAIMGGLSVDETLSRCDTCGKLYTKDWQVVGEPNGKPIPDGEIPVNYSWVDDDGFHHIDSVYISGSRCVPCLQKSKVLEKRSMEKAKKDPFSWARSLHREVFPFHIESVPHGIREQLYSEGLV